MTLLLQRQREGFCFFHFTVVSDTNFVCAPRSSLAYALLYLTIAHLMRRFDLALYETTAEDMEWEDCYMPQTRNHLRITIKKASE